MPDENAYKPSEVGVLEKTFDTILGPGAFQGTLNNFINRAINSQQDVAYNNALDAAREHRLRMEARQKQMKRR